MRQMFKATAALISTIALVAFTGCHLPGDTGKNGGVATPAISLLTVTQVFDPGTPRGFASKFVVTTNGALALQGTLTPPQGGPTPSPASLSTGQVQPGIFEMKVDVVGCNGGRCGGKTAFSCHKNVTVAEKERVTAVIHININSGCRIETVG
ncbi:MAG: hypothetical protein QOF16_1306 [Actinomycetota bacterium]|jgi:hypothetical protein|nr:hypothetical protein [Actinomycetota bacterium]